MALDSKDPFPDVPKSRFHEHVLQMDRSESSYDLQLMVSCVFRFVSCGGRFLLYVFISFRIRIKTATCLFHLHLLGFAATALHQEVHITNLSATERSIDQKSISQCSSKFGVVCERFCWFDFLLNVFCLFVCLNVFFFFFPNIFFQTNIFFVNNKTAHESRVKLKEQHGIPGSDYINASFIKVIYCFSLTHNTRNTTNTYTITITITITQSQYTLMGVVL